MGTLDKAFAASPVSPPVSGPGQNLGQQAQNGNQSGKGQNLNSEVSGSFTGSSSNLGSSANCAVEEQTLDATYTPSTGKGTGSLSMDGCVIGNFVTQTFSGSFTLITPDGATLQGTASGTEVTKSPPSFHSLSFTLTPTSGTNEFANVKGVINLTGTWLYTSGFVNIADGSLSGALT
jgi:hypothetical protein